MYYSSRTPSTEGSLQPKIFSCKNVADCSIDFPLKMLDFSKMLNFQIDAPRTKSIAAVDTTAKLTIMKGF